MENNKRSLTPTDFEFVQRDDKIHDKAFDTKPTTFLKDAVKRFCKNKSSIVAFGIIGLLVLLAIFLPIFSRKNIDYVSSPEAFLAPKIFKTGTGFWDGTRKVENVVYDTVNEVPGDYYKNGVLDLVILGDEYIDNTNNYGIGGYATFINEKKEKAYAHSYETLMTSTGNYKVEVNMHDTENYAEGELAKYAVYLNVTEDLHNYQEGETKPTETLLLLKDFSKDYTTYTLDLSKALKDNGYESVKAQLYFELEPAAEKKKSYIMLETVKFSANQDVENYDELVNLISINDANETLSYILDKLGNMPVGYWNSNCVKNAHHVKVVKCSFTYDTYCKPYDDKIVSDYAPSDLETLMKKGYCTYDKTNIKDTFKVLDEKHCPVIEILDVTYSTRGPIKAISIKCKVRGYLTYTHGNDSNTYKRQPMFIFGTDQQGHDVLKKSFAGLRTSLILGVCTAAICFCFGLVWGSISGYFGGTVDLLMERIIEIISGVPTTIMLTLMILTFGNTFGVFVFALCLTGWMGVAGRTRTQFYRYKGREYVLASRTLGSSDFRLIFKHILPNSMGTIITGSVLMITSVIYSEATLAYLNLGLQGTQSFGVMMSDNQSYLQSFPYLVLEPAIIISLLMISFNLFGNGLRDAFNPSLKGSE